MTTRATALRFVTPQATAPEAAGPVARATGSSVGDLLVLALLVAVAAVPIAGTLAGGAWGERTVGAATALALLAGRELVRELRARAWAR